MCYLCRVPFFEAADEGTGGEGQGMAAVGSDERREGIRRRHWQAEAAVYDLFVQRFPAVAMAVSFDTFSQWVDDALTEMRKMLVENQAAAELVKGDVMNG